MTEQLQVTFPVNTIELEIVEATEPILIHERPFDAVLKMKGQVYDYEQLGHKTLGDRGEREGTAWVHITMPSSFQTFIIEALCRIHKMSVNQILQRGVIEGYYIFSAGVNSETGIDFTALRDRTFKGDMPLIEGLRTYRCDITVDDINPKKTRLLCTMEKQDAETIGSHADNIRIDRQVFCLVLFSYAFRTYTGLPQIWIDRCNIIIGRFETKYSERMADITRRLDKPPVYDN